MDDGILQAYKLINTAAPGDMPKDVLEVLTLDGEPLEWQFENRVVGYNRQYVAMGVGERVDMLIRIWRADQIRIGMIAILTEYEGQENPLGDQYRISNVQHLTDEDGLKVTDLTLYRLDELYEVNAAEP